jgi:tetratricopeptide (TPR) repeat protein
LGEAETALARADEAEATAEPGWGAALLEGLRGNALMALGRKDEALDAYLRSLAAKQENGAHALDVAFSHNLVGEAAGALGRFDLAAAHLRDALGLQRSAGAGQQRQLAATLTNLGIALYRSERAGEAEAALREALALDPTLALAEETLIKVLYATGQRAEADARCEDRFRRCSFVVQPPPADAAGTLLLLWSFNGTVPHAYLLAGLPMQVVNWHIEYASPDHEQALPRYDLVLNLIGDADEGERALRHALAFKQRCAQRMLNDPARIMRTHRHEVAARLAGIEDLVIPRTVQLSAAKLQDTTPDAVLHGLGLDWPILLRHAGKHGGDTVSLVRDAAMLHHALAEVSPDASVYVTAFHDYADAGGFFRKYRVIFVDRVPYPYHLAISPKWLVHYFSAEMEDHAWKLDEERRFLDDMESSLAAPAMRVLREVAARMDLDYCGIDFSILPDGRVLFFECNATMLVHTEAEDGRLAHKNVAVGRIVSAFQGMLRK